MVNKNLNNPFSMKLPYSCIEDFITPTNYLFQGKLLKIVLDSKHRILSMYVTMPLNIVGWPLDKGGLYEQVRIDIHFQTLLIGLMNNDNLEVKLADRDMILSAFENRVFRGDFGAPDQHVYMVDHKFPLMINVHLRKTHYDLPWQVLEFVIPSMDDRMPLIKAVVKSLELFDKNNQKIKRKEAESKMIPFYEDSFVNEKDRMKIEWSELHGIKNSFEFYSNRLHNWHWFKYQFDEFRKKPAVIKKSVGDLLRPLWIENNVVKKDSYGNISHIEINNVTRKKSIIKKKKFTKEVWWLPPEDYSSLLTFLSNELVNSESENPFLELIDLYISKWEPKDTVDESLPYDLERIIDVDPILSSHPYKSDFFNQLNQYAEERGFVWV